MLRKELKLDTGLSHNCNQEQDGRVPLRLHYPQRLHNSGCRGYSPLGIQLLEVNGYLPWKDPMKPGKPRPSIASCCGGGVHTQRGGQDQTSDEILCSRNMEPPDLRPQRAPTAWLGLTWCTIPLLDWFGSSPPSLSQTHTFSASLCLSFSFWLSLCVLFSIF